VIDGDLIVRPLVSHGVRGCALWIEKKARLLAVCLFSLAGARSAYGQPETNGEALVKMEFIERFTRFVEWPVSVLGAGAEQFVLCIAGSGPVANDLPRELAVESFKGRPVQFRRVRLGDDLTQCHLLYIAPTEEPRLPAFVAIAAGRPILTIADIPGSAERGVLISLYRAGPHVRFEINRAAVQKSGLKFSARLVQLARLVGPDSK
jgi:hypothetical protein